MFGFNTKKNKRLEFEKRLSSFLPEPIVSVATLGSAGLVGNVLTDFIFLIIDAKNLEQFDNCSSKAIQIALDHQAMVVANVGGLIQLVVGPRSDLQDCESKRLILVQELTAIIGQSARIVHGRTTSHVGIIGVESRKNWGCFPVCNVHIFQVLLTSSPGIVVNLGNC